MAVLAYILAIVCWPIITFGGNLLFSVVLLPVFSLVHRPTPGKPAGFVAADIFQTVVLAATQFAAVALSKWLFQLCGVTPTQWMALPFALLCAVFLVPSISGLLSGSRMERHVFLSWVIGLPAGLALATLWMLCDQDTVGNAETWLFWSGVALAIWYALREVISVATGRTQHAVLKPGQWACHLTLVVICAVGIGLGFYFNAWWPAFVGIGTSFVLRELAGGMVSPQGDHG
ncbi:MAG TPA: hypothetical protein VM431_12845 [Phycisphaerae bacterium]|nr:hypothetical protein [Phycisphaerae bacterium]